MGNRRLRDYPGRRPKRALVAAVLGVVLAGLGAASVIAHDQGYDTQITIRHTKLDEIKGHVISDLERCVVHRGVKLFADTDGGDFLLEERQTNDAGRYSFNLAPGARYYTVAVREVIERAGHSHTCRRDRSPTVD